jgi:hypothetical protein
LFVVGGIDDTHAPLPDLFCDTEPAVALAHRCRTRDCRKLPLYEERAVRVACSHLAIAHRTSGYTPAIDIKTLTAGASPRPQLCF